jgi:hypothetical protein
LKEKLALPFSYWPLLAAPQERILFFENCLAFLCVLNGEVTVADLWVTIKHKNFVELSNIQYYCRILLFALAPPGGEEGRG